MKKSSISAPISENVASTLSENVPMLVSIPEKKSLTLVPTFFASASDNPRAFQAPSPIDVIPTSSHSNKLRSSLSPKSSFFHLSLNSITQVCISEINDISVTANATVNPIVTDPVAIPAPTPISKAPKICFITSPFCIPLSSVSNPWSNSIIPTPILILSSNDVTFPYFVPLIKVTIPNAPAAVPKNVSKIVYMSTSPSNNFSVPLCCI